jgi:CcmD family protein
MKPMRFVTSAVVLSSFALTILAVAAIAAPQKQTLTGTITDSMCPKADHSQMRMGPSDAACTLACVDAHGAMFVLYDGNSNTYTLSDQTTARKFAGKKVKVFGTVDASTKMIQVESITDKNLDSLTAAYLAVVIIFFVYLFTIARRVTRLQGEIVRLKSL